VGDLIRRAHVALVVREHQRELHGVCRSLDTSALFACRPVAALGWPVFSEMFFETRENLSTLVAKTRWDWGLAEVPLRSLLHLSGSFVHPKRKCTIAPPWPLPGHCFSKGFYQRNPPSAILLLLLLTIELPSPLLHALVIVPLPQKQTSNTPALLACILLACAQRNRRSAWSEFTYTHVTLQSFESTKIRPRLGWGRFS
jgi:hypothetical protein